MSDISSPDFERTGQAGFAVARQTMSARLSEAEIQARNELPTCVSNGDPFRVIAEEVQVEHADATHWRHEDEGGVGPAAHAPLKPGVLREVSKVTDRIPKKLGLENMSENDPEYWGIASVMTEEEAELTKHMKVRIPETLSQMVEGSGMPAGRVQELLDALCVKGVIEYNWENLDGTNPTHERRFVLPMFVPGMAEFTVMNQQQMVEHPEIGSMFERMTFLPLTKVTKMVPQGGAGIGMHVIPVERAITHENVSADVEHLSHWLRKYDRYAAGACSCTVSERARNSNAGRDAQNWCIGVGDMADYLFETGKGHYISYDEVIETLIRAEKNGYVHQITNIDGQDKIFAICNCDVNVCYALRTSQLFNTPNMSRSAYVAHVDSERCVACGGCVEICPAGAAQLGQKLCTDHGPQSYPQQPLPDDRPWGEEDWDPDYKNNNRIECHETGTAPCKTACPAHVSVQGYLRLAAEGRYRDALALIKQENPFPAVCGRVCNRRCEDACTRGTVDDAVAIDEVKRFVATKDLQSESRYVPEPRIPSNRGRLPQKVAIVGAGPAGLTCAYYLANMGYSPVVFERNPLPGGMLTYGIPAYKLQKDVVAAEIDVMREMGVEIRCGVEVGRDVTLAQLREQGFAAFYLAIGCQGGRRAGIEGEGGPDVCSAVDFLHQAIEEPQLEVSGTTVVVGGGNVAIDASRVSLRCGASSVAMVCLEQEDQMPALPVEREEARADGVAISCGWGPTRVERDEGGKVTGVSFRRCLSVFDENGRFTPLFDDSDTMLVPCDRVVMAIGQSVVWGDLLADESVDLRPNGGPLADSKTYQTAQKDVFVGGDAFTGPRFAIDAIAAGHEAAVSIHRFVQVGSSLTLGRNQRHYVELDKEHLTLPQNMSGEGRQAPTVDEVTSILHNWSDPKRCFTEEQIKIECARCLGCGASIVDPNKCIGCGLCTTRCEFDAIHLTRDNPGCSTMSPSEEKIRKILPYAAKRGIKILRNKATGRAGR
ncbi:FAD-dependent oxidoreductase [Olsenella urininfantis]|uniref:FAD-dependent oxidoreductase n=1 Tax=Olsenella urininfantis TaxID=1871033 RepID=UPI002E131A0C